MLKFNSNRLKVLLKLAINRLKLLQAKKASLNAATRRELATLLEKGKEESARIRVENVIREDLNAEALEILELYCELLIARFGLIESLSTCESGIAEAVNSIIYAAPRCDVKELLQVRDMLISKYGKEFAITALENKNNEVNYRIVQKLKIQTPDKILVNEYLKAIASAHKVDWEPVDDESQKLEQLEASLLGSQAITPGQQSQSGSTGQNQPQEPTKAIYPFPEPQHPSETGLSLPAYATLSPSSEMPSAPTESGFSLPQVPASSGSGHDNDDSKLPDFEELTKRFEALKKRKG